MRPLLRADLARSKRRLLVVGSAVAASVMVVVLLGSLSLGIYRGVIKPLLPRLPLNLLKVEPRTVSVGLLAFQSTQLSGGLNKLTIERLAAIDGVKAVYPVVGAGFPMRAEGGEGFLGRRLYTDIFATGVAKALVASDVAEGYQFREGKNGKVPVLVARRLLELYNTTVASAIDKPRLSKDAVIGFEFELVLGTSYARGTPNPARVERRVAQIVGFSDQANLIGITVPESLLRKWNEQFSEKMPITGAYVETRSVNDAGPVTAAIEQSGLKVDETLKVVGAAITIAGMLGGFFVLAILLLAAFAIAQTFFLLVGERRAELAVLRAVGAKKRDLRRLVLAEAFVVGALAGAVGVLLGAALALVLDAVVVAQLPEIPFKPTHIVSLSPLLLVAAWGLGPVASLLGAAFPAMRAAAADPAQALRT